MGLGSTFPPFALFVVVDLEEETTNEILHEAGIGGGGASQVWLVTATTYQDAPAKRERFATEGTKTVPEGFRSPFIGKGMDELANWLINKPDNVDLDPKHFAVLDQRAKGKEKSVVVCRIGGELLDNEAIDCMRFDASFAVTFLSGHDPGDWEHFSGNGKKSARIEYMNGAWTHPPFATFIVVQLDSETIEDALEEAATDKGEVRHLWLATKYEDAPIKRNLRKGVVNKGTVDVPDDFDSPFVGSKLEDLAEWLRNKPDILDLDPHHFAVLDAGAQGWPKSIVLCKIGDRELNGGKVDCMRYRADFAGSSLFSLNIGEWENRNPDGKKSAKIDYGSGG